MTRRDRWLGVVFLIGLAGGLGWWASRQTGDGYTRFGGEAYGTRYHVTYRQGPDEAQVAEAVERELQRIDALLSTWNAESELMRYNRSADPDAFELSPELAELLDRAKQIEQQTGGAYALRPDGQQIDLSAIGKGYAVDRVVQLFRREFGIDACLVEIGGEVRASGDGPSGDGWTVGVFIPEGAGDQPTPTVTLRDASIATSGEYFKAGHIIDPQTGRPVESGLLSVSVIHPDNATADALATALYVMGLERGLAWAQDNGIHAWFIEADGTRHEHLPGAGPDP